MTVRSTSTRILRRAVAGTAIVFAGSVLLLATAHADEPTQFGWWTSQNQSLPSESIPTLVPNQPSGPPNTLAPDIPSGGFEVANDTAAETSYAAISYYEYDVNVGSIVLTLAPNATDLPGSAVVACPLSSSNPFNPEAGGPTTDGPAYSCATSVPGVASADGKSITFAIAGLVQNNYLGIAIVAKQGTNSRMVFDPPGTSTVRLASSANSTSTLPTTPVPDITGNTDVLPSPSAIMATGSIPGDTTSVQTVNAGSPQIASTPSTTTGSQAQLVAETTPSATVGIGGAGVGAALVALLILQTVIRNRRNASAADRERPDQLETL